MPVDASRPVMPDGSLQSLPMVRPDKMCRPELLTHPLRRWLAPARREVDLLDPQPGERIVDLGASVGYFDDEILERIGPTGSLDLVDIDGENLALYRSRRSPDLRVRYWTTSAAHLDAIPTGEVDQVLASLVLCCLGDKEGTLEQAWRLLRPGGRILVTYPRLGAGPLRMRRSRWASLMARHPWQARPVVRGWLVHRWLLEKPPSPSVAPPKGL
ncbi:MAG: methyltransferase [Thermoplasmata archaeon]|nr:methyltransferase [Thermoplasmata archaeon]